MFSIRHAHRVRYIQPPSQYPIRYMKRAKQITTAMGVLLTGSIWYDIANARMGDQGAGWGIVCLEREQR